MNLPKAIETLSETAYGHSTTMDEKFYNACKIGIAATMRLKQWRQGIVLNPDLLLPGETED